MKRLWCLLSLLVVSWGTYADVTCYLDLVKDSCWNQFNVTITATDMNARQQLVKETVGQSKKWKRVAFKCKPGQTLYYSATFSPVFWQDLDDKVYYATKYWSLPNKLKKGDAAWEIKICFPKDFSGVPYPPEVGSNCRCQYDAITPLILKAP